MSKKVGTKPNSEKEASETKVAKLNLFGVIVTAITGLIGVITTAYFGYLATHPTPLQISTPIALQATSIAQPLTSTVSVLPTETATPIVVSGTPPSAISQSTFLIISGTTCFISVLAIFGLIVFLAKRFRNFSLEIGNAVTQIAVRREAPKAYLLSKEWQGGKREFEIHGTTRIGRSPRFADLVIDADIESSPISRVQCTIIETSEGFAIRHEGSANGTFLNGVDLSELEARLLHDGDVITLGQVERGGTAFTFRLARNKSGG